MKKIFSLLLALCVIACAAVSASADQQGNVVYSGDSGNFIFQPGTDYSVTDLFPELKDLMPGDTATQTIQIRNDASKKVKIKIYMRALGPMPIVQRCCPSCSCWWSRTAILSCLKHLRIRLPS